ncbi:MAG TPA: RDD family protein [bacterium]|jgi:uncharacterized RDD family membrane protein YckC
MFCTQCGAQNPEDAKFCFSCGNPLPAGGTTVAAPPVTPTSPPLAPPAAPRVEYAGFGRRALAMVIDSLILSVPSGLIFLLFILPTITAAIHTEDADMIASMVLSSIFSWVWMGILLSLIPLIYFSAFECSEYQATPGKMALGIIVTDMQGRRISFARSLGRNVGKILSKMILYIGFLMAAFTEKQQALHDMLADCLVVMKHPTRY